MPGELNDDTAVLKAQLDAAEAENLRMNRELAVANSKIVQLSAHNSALARMLRNAMTQLASLKK